MLPMLLLLTSKTSMVLWCKFICHLVEASQISQMPIGTGCMTCPHPRKPWTKLCKVKDKMTHTMRKFLQRSTLGHIFTTLS